MYLLLQGPPLRPASRAGDLLKRGKALEGSGDAHSLAAELCTEWEACTWTLAWHHQVRPVTMYCDNVMPLTSGNQGCSGD